MQNQATPALFEFEALPVRILTSDQGNPWFVAVDVCRVLDIAKPENAYGRLDSDERGTRTLGTLGGPQEMVIISEAGLYALTFTRRKPQAKRFKRWVTHEVLPSIRKTGSYGGININQQIALSRHRVALLKELHRTCDNALRAALHEQLAQTSRQLGLSVPELDTIGKSTPQPPDILVQLWSGLAALRELQVRYDHSMKFTQLAINLNDLIKKFKVHGIKVKLNSEMRAAMLQSTTPRFLRSNHAVHSAITQSTIKCWVFEI
jgi:prophage antirepressor-like protein